MLKEIKERLLSFRAKRTIEIDKNKESLIKALISIEKRLRKVEEKLAFIEGMLEGLKSQNSLSLSSRNDRAKSERDSTEKWSEWSRQLIKKAIEYLFIIVAAIVGVKLAGGI